MNILQMEADILEVVLDFGVANTAEKVLSMNLTVSILPFIIRKCKSMKFDNMLANMTFFRTEFSTNRTSMGITSIYYVNIYQVGIVRKLTIFLLLVQ